MLMNKIRFLGIVASMVIVFLLLGSTPALAANPPNLSLTYEGIITNAGSQTYEVNGGNVVGALIPDPTNPGSSIPLSSATLSYSLSAVVTGLGATGTATFDLIGTTSDALPAEVSGSAVIVDVVGADFPLGCVGASCSSVIPVVFLGVGGFDITINGVTTSMVSIPMIFENPYLNPFGAESPFPPIFFASGDQTLSVVTTYGTANIKWQGVVLDGTFTGTYNGNAVSGNFENVVNSQEDLAHGVESDSGTIALSFNAPYSFLDAEGAFTGTTVIPSTGYPPESQDCSSILPPGVTFPQGTCALTGAQSGGQFSLLGATEAIIGQYTTTWSVPSVTFTSQITANVPEFPVSAIAVTAMGLAALAVVRKRMLPP